MIRNETRESAHLKSRVKDLSVVPNIVSFTPLLAAITPVAKLEKNADQLYSPVLVRDTESLISNFGDPRIDPEKYIDLYSIMQIVGNGTSCYVAKVNSGDSGVYKFPFLADKTHSDETSLKSDKQTTKFVQDSNNLRRYTVAGLVNKYTVTGINGYTEYYDGSSEKEYILYSKSFATDSSTDPTPALPTTGEVDLTDKCTWSCNQQIDGTFTLEIILSEELESTINTLVASCSVDPSWGSEDISVLANTGNDGEVAYNYDSSNKKLSFTLTSKNKLENEYILLNSAINELKGDLKVDDKEPGIDYLYSSGKLVIVVTFDEVEDQTASDTLKSSLNEILKPSGNLASFEIGDKTRESHSVIAYSSMTEELSFDVYISQVKPYSLKVYYLNVAVRNNDGTNILGSAKIKLENITTNQGLVNSLNSSLGAIVRFELADKNTESASPAKDRGVNSIVKALLDTYCQEDVKNPIALEQPIVASEPNFHVSMNDYIAALGQYKAKKYVGCLMSDLVAPVSRDIDDEDNPDSDNIVYAPNQDERRSLHYNLKQIACERKDCTVVLSTPYCESKDNLTAFTVNDACDWVTSQNKYADLWEYGTSNTVDYSLQSFYLEIYYSWVKQQCTKIESGLAKSVKVLTAPSNIVINNIMTSYRERGVHYPVAGDQYGTLPETCEIVMNPKTKADRDTLVQSRINPIYDTGTRGIQIFGNETLNAGYTDLNAAHIARTLVYIRSTIDEYTERLKFSINSLVLWDTWKNYVTNYILEPLKATNALREYDVKMGTDTTTDEEIANRMIKGNISLIFYQSAEIFDLTYTIYSTATTLEEEGVI